MDFDLTSEQVSFRDAVIRFATEQLNVDVIERDAEHRFDQEGWKRCADFGLQGLPIPEAYGGSGADPITLAVAMEALGYGCRDNGLIFSVNAHMWSCEMPILHFGSETQKQRYLPGLCDGSMIGVQAITEPGSGSDAFAMTTTARADSGDWVLDGAKTFITNAPVADLFIVFAKTEGRRGLSSTSAFLVERDTGGVSVGPPFRKMGLRTSPMSEVILDGCRVPAESMLGSPGSGMAVFNLSIDWERSYILASAVGTAQRQLERTISYAQERQQFGQPIGKFQGVAHRIVDMRSRLDAARLMLYHLAWTRARGGKTMLDAALTKLFISEMFVQSSLDAVYLHGAYGYLEESDLERDIRDALGSRLYSGTSDIQRNIAARLMGL